MVTSDGPQPITHEFQDDVAGRLVFIAYRKEEDSRLHVEPGSNSFRVLQEAGAKAEMEYRGDRQRARQEMLAELNQRDPRKVAAAMRVNAEYAALKRSRGHGPFVIKGEE